jgi:transposase InsO family protein
MSDAGTAPTDRQQKPWLFRPGVSGNSERRKRYLYVAIDRRSRSVHLAVRDDETEKSAIAFLGEAAAAFPFCLTHVLTDNGSCFTPAFAKACAALGAQHRTTRPYSPHTNGMVERFNGRVGSDVLGITVWSHRDLEQLLRCLVARPPRQLRRCGGPRRCRSVLLGHAAWDRRAFAAP